MQTGLQHVHLLVLLVAGVLAAPPTGRASGSLQSPPVTETDVRERIRLEPEHVAHYLDGAAWYFEHQQYEDAERLLAAAEELLGRQSARAGGPGRGLPARGRGPLPMNPVRPDAAAEAVEIAPPVLLSAFSPAYSSETIGRAPGGLVILHLDVRPDGRVASARVADAQPAELAAAALAAAEGVRFGPTGLRAPLRVELYVSVGRQGDVSVQVLPGARRLSGYVAAGRELVRTGELERAMVVVAAAARAVSRERRQPGHATVVRPGSVYQAAPDTRGRAVRSEGPLPSYPAGIGGAVTFDAVVDVNGRVSRIDTLRGDEALMPGVVETAPQWRFVPAHADGVPIPEIVAVTLIGTPATGEVTDRPQVGIGGIQAPRKIRDVRPRYPQDAREAGEQGSVILSATIGRDGAVRDAFVMRSVSPRLDAAAIEAVLQWRFEPTEINGIPIETSMTVTVNFSVRERDP